MNAPLRFLADEDFDNDVVRGMLRRITNLDIIRAQDVGLSGAPDPTVLEWAAQQGRVLLTHDVSTMTSDAYARASSDLPIPGAFALNQFAPLNQVIGDLILLAECSLPGEWQGQVRYVPLSCSASKKQHLASLPDVRSYPLKSFSPSN
jgi:Domain of unknown function (DUF5615)